MHNDVVNDMVEIFYQRIAKPLNSRLRLAQYGEFKMASYSKWRPIQNVVLFKMASYSKWRPIQNGVPYSKCRPLFAASSPG
jgi:hypothetical protein